MAKKMYMTESEFEDLKKEFPEEEFPEYSSLEWKIKFLPSEQFDEHQEMIFRLIDLDRVQSFLEIVRDCNHLTSDEEFAVDFLYNTFKCSSNEILKKIGLY